MHIRTAKAEKFIAPEHVFPINQTECVYRSPYLICLTSNLLDFDTFQIAFISISLGIRSSALHTM